MVAVARGVAAQERDGGARVPRAHAHVRVQRELAVDRRCDAPLPHLNRKVDIRLHGTGKSNLPVNQDI